jgi:phosphatidate cytidylyltransferase
VTRVLSGAVLLAIAVAIVWFASPPVFLVAAEVLLLLGCRELAGLARSSALDVPAFVPDVAAALVCAAFAPAALAPLTLPLDIVLVSAFVAVAAVALSRWHGGREALAAVSASLLPMLYLGVPLGAMVAIRESRGPEALFLVMLTVVVSDTAQYYTGRAFGRRPLTPVISPKKTVEGAVGGFVAGALVMVWVGASWLPAMPLPLRAAVGLMIVALGITGDLFESMLKRSAGVKDGSGLIPGHGGVLDRIDALLFAAPVYYVVLKHV